MALPDEPEVLASASQSVRHLFNTALALTVPLRAGEGFNQHAFDSLCHALRECADEWVETDVIPKIAANLLVDLYPAIEASSFQYQGEENKAILRAADTIAGLVRACVAVPGLSI